MVHTNQYEVMCRRTSIQALKRLQRETFEALVSVRSRLLALEVPFTQTIFTAPLMQSTQEKPHPYKAC